MITNVENDPLFLPERPPRQYSFLLRCVEARSEKSAHPERRSEWRFSLQDPKNNAVYNFGDFEGLTAFLKNLLA